MALTKAYLEWSQLPKDKNEPWKLIRMVPRFLLLNGVLYRRGFSTPFLWCVETDEANVVLSDVHEGFCENHARGETCQNEFCKMATSGQPRKRIYSNSQGDVTNVKDFPS